MVKSRAGGKNEVDPELLMKKKFRAKCRFRACGRLVMANAYWLIEDVDQYEGVDDVKRRVEQAVRAKGKKQLLSVKDKALLNKPAAERTDNEKKYIYRIIGGLKCFKRYPNTVKRKLAAVTYFKYYSPGRVIVREQQEAHAMYFIVSGDMAVTRLEFDPVVQQKVPMELGNMRSGDMFGEVSLLHNIPRTATVTTTDHCEVLMLLREDFKNVLLATVQQQWEEVRQAMLMFTYFECFDECALREGCIVAKIKSYEINDIILGDGHGIANYVYFVLSGRCQMIEALKIIVKKHLGKKFYTLCDTYVPEETSDEDFEKKWLTSYNPAEGALNSAKTSASDQKSALEVPSTQKRTESILKRPSEVHRSAARQASIMTSVDDKLHEKMRRRSSDSYGKRTSFYVATPTPITEEEKSKVLPVDPSQRLSTIAEGSTTLLQPTAIEHRQSARISAPDILPQPPMPPQIETFFMQVCQYNVGSSFGFGENMRDRRILALTPVQCLLFPKIWLLQRNTANIWTRIQYYLEKKIPTKQKLFENFIEQRRWEEFKYMLVDDVLLNCKTVNYTTVHDVPYSIRMEEMFDVE